LEEAYTDACSGSKITDEWFGYDADGRMTDVYQSTPHSGTPYYHTSSCYWPNGAMESLSGIPGVPAIYYGNSACTNSGNGLDGEGRVTQVTAASGTNPASIVSYSPTTTTTALAGSLTGISFPSGDSDSFTFDPTTGRQTGYTFSVNKKTDTGSLNWNANGTLGKLGIVDNLKGSTDSQNCNYYYDDLGRLGGVDSNGYSVDCGSIWSQLFTFDPFGNIQKSGSLTFAATYSVATNRYTLSGVNVQYDGNGNLLTDNLNTYTWDPNFGNPASVNGVNLIYDALGQMVEQQNGSAYKEILYSPAGKTALMNGQTLTKGFLYLPGGVTGIYNSSGLAYYRHSDWLGSSRLTSTATTPTSPYSISAYAPFGEQYDVSGTSDPSFTGQNSDTVSSLYDFTFREHSPSQGRWVSPDPAGLSAVDPTNPQSWNRYAYVLNNPLSYRDPLGLWCVWEDGSHDDDEGDGGASSTDCANQGGHWDQFDNITGIFQDGNGNVTQINSVWGTSNLGANSGFTLSDFDTSLASYQDTTVTVGQFSNTMFNPFNHVALQIGNGAFYGQAPRSTLAFLRHFAFGSPNTPGVPGTIEVQNPSAMTNGITFPVSGAQAGMIQSEINQSLQNPPPYDVYGPSPTCDCAFWIQNVLGGAGINSGAPTIYPSQLLWQLQQAIP
jgi:RHS repeat-associated protein